MPSAGGGPTDFTDLVVGKVKGLMVYLDCRNTNGSFDFGTTDTLRRMLAGTTLGGIDTSTGVEGRANLWRYGQIQSFTGLAAGIAVVIFMARHEFVVLVGKEGAKALRAAIATKTGAGNKKSPGRLGPEIGRFITTGSGVKPGKFNFDYGFKSSVKLDLDGAVAALVEARAGNQQLDYS